MADPTDRTSLRTRTETDVALLALVRRQPAQTSRGVAHALFLSRAQAQLALRRLSDAGLLRRTLGAAGEYEHSISLRGSGWLERRTREARESV